MYMHIENHRAYMTVLHGNDKSFVFISQVLPIDNFDSPVEIMLSFSAGIELTDIKTSAYRKRDSIHE